MSDGQVKFTTLGHDLALPGQEERFGFKCPKGNGYCEGLLIRSAEPTSKRPSWIWDGNRAKPTFTPSINCEGCWHGRIVAGRCVDVGGADEPEPAS